MSAAILPACDCFFRASWVSELCPVKPGRALKDKVGFDILLMMMRLTRGGFELSLRTIMGQRRCYFMMGCWWSDRLLVVLDLFVQPGIISEKLCWHLWLQLQQILQINTFCSVFILFVFTFFCRQTFITLPPPLPRMTHFHQWVFGC